MGVRKKVNLCEQAITHIIAIKRDTTKYFRFAWTQRSDKIGKIDRLTHRTDTMAAI